MMEHRQGIIESILAHVENSFCGNPVSWNDKIGNIRIGGMSMIRPSPFAQLSTGIKGHESPFFIFFQVKRHLVLGIG